MKNLKLVEDTQKIICDELNKAGFEADEGLEFDPELFPSMKSFVETALLYDPDIYSFLESKNLIHLDFCLLCGRSLNSQNTIKFTFFDRWYNLCQHCYKIEVPQHKQPKEGCYIATACYGDYDHPDVLVLRRFRDEYLYRSNIGTIAVKAYYRLSPELSERLKNHKNLNKVIKTVLLRPMVKLISFKRSND